VASNPILSFITPSFNRRSFIQRCIESIPHEMRDRVEHIIVDGQSNDGTQDFVRQYPHIRLICEKDKGLYDALNKGLKVAKGTYVGFLAADDQLDKDFFVNLRPINLLACEADIIGFSYVNHRQDRQENCEAAAQLSFESAFIGKSPLFSLLINRIFWEGAGSFDERFRIAGDFDMILRLCASKFNYTRFNFPMYHFFMHDLSLTGHSNENRDAEYGELLLAMLKNRTLYVEIPTYSALAKDKTIFVAKYFRRRGAANVILTPNVLKSLILFASIFDVAAAVSGYWRNRVSAAGST
jgi:glycosyltransferase involved in cell wall biosynthesis